MFPLFPSFHGQQQTVITLQVKYVCPLLPLLATIVDCSYCSDERCCAVFVFLFFQFFVRFDLVHNSVGNDDDNN